MQRILCPDTDLWTMVGRFVSGDVARLGNAQWWNLASHYISDQLVRRMQCEAETKGCCVVST